MELEVANTIVLQVQANVNFLGVVRCHFGTQTTVSF